ncbi:ZYRO0B08624p [Zygosaccharomyces rouxii]|uniref:ZYRO0B08624p n=1 Tax=Zygosaccharomyces rouxii (strain ATCC 2623 / CBS 732 / NBRC 1130 / NCYC 568 / NRRL Y-229) TaxID=559307 RepID=C5DRI1_ZYGRC|nr:uncharacterized protein ZYRO0B08624g [Zygosaccharomyces rouxii]KAH9200070.1 hypothetical protein LQ764DRAFT_112126 [Zygosaccharomyces rouxii]CAR26392.1 ZYRO0B08624p [Zygosaccharomyces rouxii]
MEELKAFVTKFDGAHLPTIDDDDLRQTCSHLRDHATDDVNTSLQVIQCLSYFTMDKEPRGSKCLETIKIVVDKLTNDTNWSYDELLTWLIDRLRPLLLRTKESSRQSNKNENNALKPKVGQSYKEDEQRQAWRNEGGLKSIPFFYVVLFNLKNRHVSSNLWWITPGILNILDDTTDIVGVKLKGVILLRVFLENCFEDQKNWVSFSDLGLYELYSPILWNLCYYLPPSYDSNTSLSILQTVFPTLNSLYRLQFISSDLKYKYHLGKFLSEILLQNLIPRVNFISEPLTAYALDVCCRCVRILGVSSAVHLQRMIYVLGEYLVRNPFFTAFDSLMDNTLSLIHTMIVECPAERVVAHKYDFYGLLLISFGKCKQEGKLTQEIMRKFKRIRESMKATGCDPNEDKDEILANHRYMEEFFN